MADDSSRWFIRRFEGNSASCEDCLRSREEAEAKVLDWTKSGTCRVWRPQPFGAAAKGAVPSMIVQQGNTLWMVYEG